MTEHEQKVIELLERIAKAVETPPKATKKKGSKPAGEKKPLLQTSGVVTFFKGQNQWGWFKAGVNGREFSTKSTDHAGILHHAYAEGWIVAIDYNEDVGPKWTNYYIHEVTVVDKGGKAAAAPEDDDDVPF